MEYLPQELVELVLEKCPARGAPTPSSTADAPKNGEKETAAAIDVLLTGLWLSRVCRPLLSTSHLAPVVAAQHALLSSQVDGCFSSAAVRLNLPPAHALSAALSACGGHLPPHERLLLWAADTGHVPALRHAAVGLGLDTVPPTSILFPVLTPEREPLLQIRSPALRRRVLELSGRGGHACVLACLANQGLLVHLSESLVDADPVTGPREGRAWADGLRAAVHAAAAGRHALVVSLLCHSCCALGATGAYAQQHLDGWVGLILRSAAYHGRCEVMQAVHAVFGIGHASGELALRAAEAGASVECAEWLLAVMV